MLPRNVLLALLVLACSESSGPRLDGAPFFTGTVNGRSWNPGLPYSGCADFGLQLTFPIGAVIPGNDLLTIMVRDVEAPATYALGDSASGRFAQTLNLRSQGSIHRTHAGNGDHLTITRVSFTDSVAVGSVRFRLISDSNRAATYDFTGQFRVQLVPVYTVAHPDGTPCFGAT